MRQDDFWGQNDQKKTRLGFEQENRRREKSKKK